MAEPYREFREAPGFGKKLGDSFKGILFGAVIFLLAFPLLWWGENRKNTAEFVDAATAISATDKPAVASGSLVKTTGRLATTEALTDPGYLSSLGSEKALLLKRDIEMFAYVEHKESKEGVDPKTGKKGHIDEYTYTQEWTSSPGKSFKDPRQPANPTLSVSDKEFLVRSATVGTLSLDAAKADFRGLKDLAVTAAMLDKSAPRPLQAAGDKIYVAVDANPYAFGAVRQVATSPKIGDMRLSYRYFPSEVDAAVVGAWDGSKITNYIYDKTGTFLAVGEGSLDELRRSLETEHNLISWVVRIASFIMMFMGLNGILGPILAVMDAIPLVGGAGRAMISLVTFVISAVLWVLTWVLARYLWLILVLVVVAIAGLVLLARKSKKSAPVAAPVA